MIKTPTSSQDLVGFEAEDEFQSPAADPWRPSPAGERVEDDDPFLSPQDPLPPFDAEPQSPVRPAPSPNPVGEMIAGAEAALGEAALPRIRVHIFWVRQETADVAQSAAADRRMARTSTLIHPGGLAAAVEHYQNLPTPALVIVECLEQGATMIPLLDRLAEVCDPGTKVIVIGGHNDIALYRELMRRGVSEYLVPPLQPLQLISAIATLYADPARRSSAGRSPSSAPAAESAPRPSPITWPSSSARLCDQHRHRRSGPALRHRRPRLQPGPPARRRRRPQPAGSAGPGAARPDDGPLLRTPRLFAAPATLDATTTSRRRPSRRSPARSARRRPMWCSICRICGPVGCGACC